MYKITMNDKIESQFTHLQTLFHAKAYTFSAYNNFSIILYILFLKRTQYKVMTL